ncbi:MAG TPA: site-2 protease family protein, partial [Ilumatobacteraceae bacterium]|nr:site-2 protease family protein [Ilumatobacteraceae bacterium]
MSTRYERFQNEMAAGGSVAENTPDEQPELWVQIVGIGAWIALFGVLAIASPWVLVFVIGLLISIFLHEVGHFVTARRSGMKVTQFFMGFGPRVFSFHRDGVEYGLRAIPLGAFVRIIGMNNLDDVPTEDEPHTYRQASYPKRMLVITAGSVMHCIIAFVTIIAVYGMAGRVEESGRVTVAEVVSSIEVSPGVALETPAVEAGIQPGDVMVSVNGQHVATAAAFRDLLAAAGPGTNVSIEVIRDGEPITVHATLVQHPQIVDEPTGFLG